MPRPKIDIWDGWQPSEKATFQLKPLFPIGSLTPHSHCPHRKPIRRGSVFCCMVCHRSGKDHLPMKGEPIGSRPDPDYKVEAEPTSYKPESKPRPKTRVLRQARRKPIEVSNP